MTNTQSPSCNAELLDGPAASGDDASATGALRTRFATLRRRLADATIEHFNLDASSAGGRARAAVGRRLAALLGEVARSGDKSCTTI